MPLCPHFRNGNVEKWRQRRSRPFAVLTYSSVRSARQSAFGLADHTFLRRWLRTGFEHLRLLLEGYEMNNLRTA